MSGGFYDTVGALGGRALAGPQTAQTDVQQGQADQRPFWQAEPVTGDFTANETGPANTEPVRAGRVTTIQSPYTGQTPVNTSPQTQGQALTIGASAPADRQTTMRDFQAQRQAQAARDFAAIGEPIEEAVQAAPAAQTAQTPETIQTQAAAETQAEQLALEQEPQRAASVPVTEAIQYGKTPDQAMQDAAVRAQGEARH